MRSLIVLLATAATPAFAHSGAASHSHAEIWAVGAAFTVALGLTLRATLSPAPASKTPASKTPATRTPATKTATTAAATTKARS